MLCVDVGHGSGGEVGVGRETQYVLLCIIIIEMAGDLGSSFNAFAMGLLHIGEQCISIFSLDACLLN